LLISEKHIKDLIKRSAHFKDVASLKFTAGHKSITEFDIGSASRCKQKTHTPNFKNYDSNSSLVG
jgi:hypothetical protein